MANGYPLSAVVGDREVMDAARKTWISSTLACDASALAAAGAVLTWHNSAEVCESLWTIGAEMRKAVVLGDRRVGREGNHGGWTRSDVAIPVRFAGARDTLPRGSPRNAGVLFKRGAYNYAALARRRRHSPDRSGGERCARDAARRGSTRVSKETGADSPIASRPSPTALIDSHAHFLSRRRRPAPIGRTSTRRAFGRARRSASPTTSLRCSGATASRRPRISRRLWM